MSDTSTQKKDHALEFAWVQYRTFAGTARDIKSTIDKWRKRVFIFTLAGALFAVLGQNASTFGLEPVSRALSALSGLLLSLAAYAGAQVLTDEREKTWIRTRAAAESFKSEAYLYLFKAGPYAGGNARETLFTRVEELLNTTSDIQTIPADADATKDMPEGLTFEGYIEKRCTGQVNGYYLPKAKSYDLINKRAKNLSFAMGFVSIVLGSAGAFSMEEYTTVWVAFIASLTASVAAYVSANRYQYLVVSYQSTAKKLLMLTARFSRYEQPTGEQQGTFVAECESLLSLENGAWLAELSQPKTTSERLPEPEVEQVG
ncbi:MAG: DUF4231 domain-containing protein [Flavobacteriales bacterium]|nr:DUF4231 domain-containing protein [Flavobacteriales bacterium]MCB9448322.1 DUF4231 domain-containing protein [Flavobacteriales bacterium]